MYNNGMMALALPAETIDRLFSDFSTSETTLETDLHQQVFIFRTANHEECVPFDLSGFDRELVEAGGWVEYADLKY
jgi:3-isopropylmalate/(R)-2-methylmalate dehydratase small subunit